MSDDGTHLDEQELQAARAEVERAAQHYYYTPLQQGIDNRTKAFIVRQCLPFFRGERILELGYVDGLWTDALLAAGHAVDIVEGAIRHVEHARQRYAGNQRVRVCHALFQEYEPDGLYDTILAGDMLRYLSDPAVFLRKIQAWLTPQGRLIATLPNSRSLHRRIGTLLNMESTPAEANTRDREVGNRASYDRYEFRHLLLQAGYQIEELHGCFLKPFSSAQMQDWSDELLQAFFEVGQELEDYCWFLYAVCRKRRRQR